MMHTEILESFRQALREHGLETDEAPRPDGTLHRIHLQGDKAGHLNGWYVLHTDGIPSGAFGCWKRGINVTWRAETTRPLSPEDQQALAARAAVHQRAQEEARANARMDCRAKAERLWAGATEVGAIDHPYLARKGVGAYGVRQFKDSLVVPMRDAHGELTSLQLINPDGTKRFLKGTTKTGHFHRFGQYKDRVLICEGYATGASLHAASGEAVAVAFDSGNLLSVAQAIRTKLPDAELILCADNDHLSHDNPGLRFAQAAAAAVKGHLVVPIFAADNQGTDFNDLHQQSGIDAVVACLANAITLAEKPEPAPEDHDHDALLKEAAGLPQLEYFKQQTKIAEKLGVKASQLDRLVKEVRGQQAKAAEALAKAAAADDDFESVEPWPIPVDADALLTHMTEMIQRFTVLSLDQAQACALWSAFTWFIDAAQVAPLLNISSPVPRCGKSTLGQLVFEMVKRPLYASNISAAAVFRCMEKWQPTLVIDEADTFLAEKEELRGIINAGHYRKTAFVVRVERTETEALEPVKFSTWGAKALIGIGKLAHTLTDRSVIIELRRKLPSEHVEKLRHAPQGTFLDIRRQLARWSQDEQECYGTLRIETIEALNDRAADNWEPLQMVAALAGGHWPQRCRKAAWALSGSAQEAPSTDAELLADIQELFARKQVDKFFTRDLLAGLCEDSEAPWATWNRGKEMSARQLATRLTGFGISSGTVRIGLETLKGYKLEQFTDVFARYLTSSPI